MPQMQYNSGPGSMMQETPREQYSKQIVKKLTENIHTGVENLGNNSVSVELNQNNNLTPYMQPTFNTKVRELILNSQHQERRLQEGSQFSRGNSNNTKRTVLHVQNQQMFQTDRSKNVKKSREDVVDVVQRGKYDAASPRLSSRDGQYWGQEQSTPSSRTATGRISTRNATRFGGGGMQKKPTKNSPAAQSLTNKSIISYDQYQNFINQYQAGQFGQNEEVDQSLQNKFNQIYGPSEDNSFAPQPERYEHPIQTNANNLNMPSTVVTIGSQNPLYPFQNGGTQSSQMSQESPRRSIEPLRAQIIQFGLNQGPIKFDGYSGPFNKRTHTGSLKRERNIVALKNKNQGINVFGGLNTANTLVTDALSQNAMLTRVRILRKTQNVSPHVRINDQINPDLKELKAREPLPFGTRKNTIQHEPSIQFDDGAKDKMLKIQNRKVDLFLMSGQGKPKNSEKLNQLNQLINRNNLKSPSLWGGKGSVSSTARGVDKDRISPQMAVNAAEIAQGFADDYTGGVPHRQAVDIATGISHDYADATAQTALRTGHSREAEASQGSPNQSYSRGTPAGLAEIDYLSPVDKRANPGSDQYEMEALREIAQEQVNIINHQLLQHQMQTGKQHQLNLNHKYQQSVHSRGRTTPKLMSSSAAPQHAINLSKRESGKNVNTFGAKRPSFQQNQDLYDGQKLIFPSRLKSLIGTQPEPNVPKKKLAVMGQPKNVVQKSELCVAESDNQDKSSLATKSMNFNIAQPGQYAEHEQDDTMEGKRSEILAQEKAATVTITCETNPKKAKYGGSGSPTITITPPVPESPEPGTKNEHIRILQSPDKVPDRAALGNMDHIVIGTSLRPVQISKNTIQGSLNELSPVQVSRMQALGDDNDDTASFARKLQDIVLADGGPGSLEQLKTEGRPSRDEISPPSREVSKSQSSQDKKSNQRSPSDGLKKSGRRSKKLRSKSIKLRGLTLPTPKGTPKNQKSGFKIMMPIKTKLYYAEMPVRTRPSLKGAGSPKGAMQRFGSRLSSQNAREAESPGRNMVNMIAQGGRKAELAIDQSYRAYKRSSLGEPQPIPDVKNYSPLQQRHFIIPKLRVQEALDQDKTQDMANSNEKTYEQLGQEPILENDPLSIDESSTTHRDQAPTERTTRLQNQTSPQDFQQENFNFGLAFPTLSPKGAIEGMLVPQRSSESYETQNQAFVEAQTMSHPGPDKGGDQTFQFPPSYAILNVGVDKKAPSTREPIRVGKITKETHQNVTRTSFESYYNSTGENYVSVRDSQISNRPNATFLNKQKQHVPPSVPPLFLACVGRASREENRDKFHDRSSNASSTLRREMATTGRILGAPLNTDTRTASDIAELVALQQVQFPTKKNPQLPQKERGMIRFKHDDPPANYTLGMTMTTINGVDPDAGLTHRQKLGVMRNERAKAKNLKDQHAWKLKTREDQVQKGLKIQLNFNRQTLVKQFLREDQERRRMFGGLDETTISNKVGSRRVSMGQTSTGFSGSGSNYFTKTIDTSRNNVSSSRADHMKQRLVNGLTTKYIPENQRNFLAPIQRRPGFSTTLPGARFNQQEKSVHGIEARGSTPHRISSLAPQAIRSSTRGHTVETDRHKPLSYQIQQELAHLTTDHDFSNQRPFRALRTNHLFGKNQLGLQNGDKKNIIGVASIEVGKENAEGTILGSNASVLQTRENLFSPGDTPAKGQAKIRKTSNTPHVRITTNDHDGAKQETFSETQAQIIAKYTTTV